MRKYIFLTLIFAVLSGCKKDDNNSLDEQVMIDLNINLNLFLDFSLELDNSSSNSSRSSFKTDSDFVNVFDDELTIKFTSEPAGFQNSLTFNPSDSNASVRLPYGNYNWEIESSIVSGTAISQKLPVYGQSSSTILINEPNVNLDLVVQTDYSLVTVNSEHVSSVILKHDDDSLNLESKDGFFYGYVFSGATSFTLEVTDKEGSKITTTIDSVESCKEYKYTLNYSNVNVSSLVCLCDPFEVIERFIQPICADESVLTNGIVAWYPFNGNANDESGNGNDGINSGAILTSDRDENQDSAYYFSGNNCSTRIDVDVDTSSIETNQSFSVSLWYRHNGGGCIGPRLMEFWPGSDSYGKFTVNTNKNLSTGSFSPNIDYRSSMGRMGVRWDLKPEEEWTHLVYTIDQSSYKIYQNGELLTGDFYNEFGGQTSGTIKLAQNGAFGRMNHSAWDAIDGYLDDIGIWNRVLTDCEVEWLYEN